MSSKYVATHVASELTHFLLNPTPTNPLTALSDKETEALKQLAEIFNKVALPPQVTPPPPEATPEASPVPPLMVDPQGDISFRPGRAPRQSPQHAPHIITDDT